MRLITILAALTLAIPSFAQQNLFSNPRRQGWIVAALKKEASYETLNSSQDISALIREGNILSISPRFKLSSDYKPGKVNLASIFALRVSGDESFVADKLMKTGLFRYAEPWQVPQLCYSPNDPSLALQYHIAKIKAPEAWDISKGDSSVVIGITDTGIDLYHPDIQPNISYNYLDPIDNIDNDNDGFTDNFHGWDLGENDPYPQCNANWHGLHVSGISSATTDNALGVAGVGFRCRFMPLKISDATGALTMAYDGVVYAADHGCQVINCSWGGFGGGQFGQDIVDYAVFDRNSLVVASAGNNGDDQLFFPASYRNVISVAASDQNDNKKANSSYGNKIDLAAPGEDIFSTWVNAGYTASGGTSSAGPVVAGAAGIVKAFFPALSALQIGEQLKATSDVIDTIQQNLPYLGKLGRGRVNLFRALTETNHPSVVLVQDNTTDNGDMAFVAGDTLSLTGIFVNYLNQAPAVTVECSTDSPYILFLDSTTSLGDIAVMDSASNDADPFRFVILSGAPVNHKVQIKLKIISPGYEWLEYVTVMVNVDYLNISVNNVSTTISSKGNIGYSSYGASQGLGFVYNSQNLLFEAGLMLASSSALVSDRIRSNPGAADNDLLSVTNIHPVLPSLISDFDCEGVFNDSGANNPIPLKVLQNAYAWDTPGNERYVRFEYRIINPSGSVVNNVYAGIFADWDIMNASMNRADVDPQNRMGYCFSSQPQGLYAAIQLLSQQTFRVYSIDLVTGGLGGINLADGFDSPEKYTSLSSQRIQAGTGGSGNDVAQVVGSGPFDINPNDTITLVFALHAGNDLAQIQSSAQNAFIQFNGSPVGASRSLSAVYHSVIAPNPADDFLNISINPEAGIEIFSSTGMRLSVVTEASATGMLQLPTKNLPDGIYFLKITDKGKSVTNKFAVIHR